MRSRPRNSVLLLRGRAILMLRKVSHYLVGQIDKMHSWSSAPFNSHFSNLLKSFQIFLSCPDSSPTLLEYGHEHFPVMNNPNYIPLPKSIITQTLPEKLTVKSNLLINNWKNFLSGEQSMGILPSEIPRSSPALQSSFLYSRLFSWQISITTPITNKHLLRI